MSDITFRSTSYPIQHNVPDPFSNISITNLNQTSKLISAPFFRLIKPNNNIITEKTETNILMESGEEAILEREDINSIRKLPGFVCPGGYHGTENFIVTFNGTELTINPGYCIINEMLVQFKSPYVLDVSKKYNYLDSSSILPVSGSVSSSYTGKLYCVIYYSEYGLTGDDVYYGSTGASGSSGTSGSSGESGVSGSSGTTSGSNVIQNVLSKSYPAYIGIITQPYTYTDNFIKYCFLYYVTVSVVRNKVIAILSKDYTDPNNILMARRLPDFLYA